jgi:anti-anti-sigma factor
VTIANASEHKGDAALLVIGQARDPESGCAVIEDPSTPRDGSRHASARAIGELTTSSQREGHVHTLYVAGELDLATADRMQAELECIESTDATSIVIDLAGLTFMDCTGMRLLLRAGARSPTSAHRLTLRPGNPAVQRVFALCGADELPPLVARGIPTDK